MKKSFGIFVFALIVGMVFVFPLAAQRSKSDFQKMYMDYLKKQGHAPSIDNDGDVQFTYRGDTYFIIVLHEDPQLFRVIGLLDLENTPRAKSIEAANYANSRTYVTTVYITQDGKRAIFSAEIILPKPRDFQQVFTRVMTVIQDAEGSFLSQLK